jgi:CDGSH-type Zn-finger protein
VRVVDAEGNVLYEGERAALCRCGGSANKPFCDGTHEKIGFHG